MTTEITWVLISKDGERRNLSPEMVFVGTHECEVNLKCKSVDKQHAVINFDSVQNAFRIKDLGSLNGTFVNETRLPEQIYITLKHGDQVRFGYGSEEFSISRIVRVRNLSQKERSSATSSKSSKTSRTSSSSSSSTKSSSAIKSSISFTVKSKSTTECPKTGKEEEASCASSKKSISVPSFSSKEPKKTSVVADGQSSDRSGNNSRTSQGSNETKRNLATSQSVENWFAMNRPVRSTTTIPLETAVEGDDEDKEEETSPDAANKQKEEEELEVVWSFPVSEAGTNRQVKIAESDRKSSKNSSKKKTMKSKASSSSSSSSSSKKSTNASETGTYTVDEEELKATTDKKDKKKDEEVVDIDDEVSAARKEFVNEWINQHQITEKTSLKSDEMSSSSSGSQRVRRSLPAIPPSSVHNKYPGSPKLTNGSSKRSERTSNDHRRTERGGDSKKTSSVRSTDRRNDGKNSIIKTESLRSSQRNNSNNKVVQEAPDSPGPLVRSGSFTMDKPSGLVPDSEIPNVSLNADEKKKLPYKMTRSGSFTKEPGISQDLIPKIEDEKTNGGTASPKTSKKDFNSTTDKMSTISVTNGRNESATQVRESPRRALSNAVHKQVRRSQESVSRVRSRSSSRDRQSPVITNHVRNTAVSSPKPWLNQKPATPIPRTLTSDNERSKTPPTKIQRQRSSSSVRPNNTTTTKNNNYSSDCEPSGLRLTRTTLLRQSKAKDRTNKGGRQSYGNNSTTTTTSTVTSSTTNNLPAREKKKVRNSTSERLNQLSKPPTRRLNSRTSGNESSDTEAKAGIRPGRRKSAANLGEKKRNGGKPLRRSMTSSNMESSEQRTSIDTNTSLGTKIVRQSRYNQLNDNGNSGRRRQQQVNPGRHRITNTSTSLTSESENEEIDDDIRRRVYERHRAVGLKPYGRSPPDGEMSDQIARYSNDLVRNLSLLSSKSVDENTSTISDTTSNTTVILQPSNADSLEITSTILTNEPLLDNYEAEMAAVDCTNDRIQRKTWNSTQANGDALDSLMLSNVCALSVRLCAISDGLTGKIALLHARSAPYDTSKSQVPLLQQTSSQEMATLVNNLRHVESQLLRADRILDPDHKLRDLMHD